MNVFEQALKTSAPLQAAIRAYWLDRPGVTETPVTLQSAPGDVNYMFALYARAVMDGKSVELAGIPKAPETPKEPIDPKAPRIPDELLAFL